MNEQAQASQSAEALAGQAGAERAPATPPNEVPPTAESAEPVALTVAPSVALTVAPSVALAAAAGAAAPVLSESDYGPAPQTFAEMGLAEDVLQSLLAMGFSEPLQVQRRVYRPIMAGRDLIVQSRTGSGKTAAFGIPFVQALIDPTSDVKNGHPQALVLGPTRELTLQVATEISRIAERRAVQVVPVYGGAPMGRQIELLRAGGHVVSGTPGRVLDHLRRGTLHLDRIKVLVLDEADEMLSLVFLGDILEIIKRCPADRQTLLFSATMPDEVVRLAGRHQKSALMIQMSADYVGVAEVVHAYYMVTGMGRMRDLLRVLEVERPDSAVIFCNTREETSQVAEFMRSQGLDAEAISSDLSQADRERVMGRMKAKDLKYLVATDVAARGIDISDLSHVINYTFPESAEVYVHRTGRTGRAGKSGVAISLISPRELGNFYYLKLTYKIRPEERALPSEAEMQTLHEGQYLDRLQSEAGQREPGAVFRALLRRILASEDGERLIAYLLEHHLTGRAPARAESAGPAEPRRERPRSESPRPREEGRESRSRGPAERDPRGRGERPRGREDERPARGEPRGRGERSREHGEERLSRRRREEEAKAAAGPVAGDSAEAAVPAPAPPAPLAAAAEAPATQAPPVEVNREPAAAETAARPETAARLETAARPETEGSAVAGDPEARRRRRRSSSAARSALEARPAGAPQPSNIIHAEDGREFWEAWVDSRTAATSPPSPAAAPTAEGAPRPAEAAAGTGGDEASPAGERRPRRRSPRTEQSRPPAAGEVRLYLNLGRRDNVDEAAIGQFLQARGLKALPMELHTSHTYLYAPDSEVDGVVTALGGQTLAQRAVVCERARR